MARSQWFMAVIDGGDRGDDDGDNKRQNEGEYELQWREENLPKWMVEAEQLRGDLATKAKDGELSSTARLH